MNLFYKIFIGKPEYNFRLPYPAIENQIRIIQRIWNNETHNDTGIEKLLRLFLASIQFCFPAIYMRHFLWKKGYMYQSMAIEFYVLFKTALPLIFFILGWYTSIICIIIIVYQLFETLFYIATLLFVADELVKPKSFRRSVLLLVIDYFQISFGFAMIYAGFHLLNAKAVTIMDHIYFSFVTSATIGFGDIYPECGFGKAVVCIHSVFFFVFVVLFINHFASRVVTKDFYDVEKDKGLNRN